MPQNKIQSQKGLSVSQFLVHYDTAEKCEAFIEAARWPDGFVCPKCLGRRHSIVWHMKRKHYQCSKCRRQTSVISGTLYNSTKMPLHKWFLGMFLLSQSKNNVAALELKRLLGVSYRTAWRFKHKVMQSMAEKERHRRLKDRVEVNLSYLIQGMKSPEIFQVSRKKLPLIAALETDKSRRPLRVVLTPMATLTTKAIVSWAHENLEPRTTIHACPFTGGRILGASSHQVKIAPSKGGSTAMHTPALKWVKTIFGNLQSAIEGTYHGIKIFKYAKRYLGSIQYRFNRRFDLGNLFEESLTASSQTGPRTEKWLRS